MKIIKINFKTLTPLWTGDAWGESNKIRPSSIMGSLRFWFEVICYFAGITKKGNYKDSKLNDNLDEKEFRENVLKNGANFEGVDKTLAELGISLPSRVFGCTGWKGWVRIKRIEPIEDYCFGNRLNLPYGIAVKKDFSEVKELDSYRELRKLDIKDYSSWFFSKPYFFGKFEITFEIEENIIEPLFYPLLTFIERYGFLGGKWNIGYGRVKVEKLEEKENGNFKEIDNWRKEEIRFGDSNIKRINDLVSEENSFSQSTQFFEYVKFFLEVDSFYYSNERDFNNKIANIPTTVKVVKLSNNFNNFKAVIQELLKIKAQIRNCLRHESEKIISLKDCYKKNKFTITQKLSYKIKKNNNEIEREIECSLLKQIIDFRHKLLGATSNDREGTKIIPWIYEENGQLNGGFVSIAGIINLGG
jgi:CRISPR-associated protein Cmr1